MNGKKEKFKWLDVKKCDKSKSKMEMKVQNLNLCLLIV